MTPTTFPEKNIVFKRPPDMEESQCLDIPAWTGTAQSGSLDGDQVVVVAWSPSPEEIELIRKGKPIYLSCVGGLPPHFLSMSFQEATNPA
jgi:hypothetical protein